jgi:hypothetical protein
LEAMQGWETIGMACSTVYHRLLTFICQLFQSDIITYTLSSHYKDIKHASATMLELYPIGALILSIQAARTFLLMAISHSDFRYI